MTSRRLVTPCRPFVTRLVVVAVFATAVALVFTPAVGAQSNGLQVAEGRLVDAAGDGIVLRGVNHPHAWFPDKLGSLADIKASGANSVRIVLSTGARFQRTTAAELELIIGQCASNRLICVLEIHDTTGFPETPDSVALAVAAQYWITNAAVLRGHEAHVIINIGNEPFSNIDAQNWTAATIDAVQRLRSAGLEHTLMVDAPNWGQDWSFVMSDNAPAVFESDLNRNVVFDVHMYGVFEDGADVRAYIESFVARRLPLVIGEFGPTHTDGDADVDAILAWADAYGIGYLGWSWSGNTDPVMELNLVEDFDPDRVTAWGRRLISGAYGLRSTVTEVPGFNGTETRPLARATALARRFELGTTDPLVLDRVEAEDGTLNGLGNSVQGAGFSGEGYVNGLDHVGDSVAMTVFVDSAGSYDLVIGYRARFGDKTQTLYVNGQYVDDLRFGSTDQFASMIYRHAQLQVGYNTIQISHNWGWIDLDYVQVQSTAASQLRPLGPE